VRVLLLSRYGRLGASSRVRSYSYLPFLESQGIEVVAAPLLDDGYIRNLYAGRRPSVPSVASAYARRLRSLLAAAKYDGVWIEKEALPWLPAWAEALLRRAGTRYVVDYDDAIFHAYDQHRRRLIRGLLGTKIDAVMRNASLVIAGNRYIAGRAEQAGARRVEVLPSAVDTSRYVPSRPLSERPFTIGWIGTPSTSHYLAEIRPALATLCGDGRCEFRIIGDERVRLEGVPLTTRPWSEETEVGEIQDLDVGIMPLPDGPWERGKCGYKLIQYMGCAKPVVASPVGANLEIVEPGLNGYLASSANDWVAALSCMRADPALRARLGGEGRRKVEEAYSIQVTAPRLAGMLRSAGK